MNFLEIESIIYKKRSENIINFKKIQNNEKYLFLHKRFNKKDIYIYINKIIKKIFLKKKKTIDVNKYCKTHHRLFDNDSINDAFDESIDKRSCQ